MKTWPLSQQKFAIVDDDTFDALVSLRRRWQASRRGRLHYAVADVIENGKRKRVYMHRWILGTRDRVHVDHINGDGLDNRRENLRTATSSENARNRFTDVRGSSRFLGVARSGEHWRAYVTENIRQISIGVWPSEEMAACARDIFVSVRFPTSTLNFRSEERPFTEKQLEESRCSRRETGHSNIRHKGNGWEVYVRRASRKVYVGRTKTLEDAVALQRSAEVTASS